MFMSAATVPKELLSQHDVFPEERRGNEGIQKLFSRRKLHCRNISAACSCVQSGECENEVEATEIAGPGESREHVHIHTK
jgi:hypothetical protein